MSDRGILYRIYLNEEYPLAAVYGFRRRAPDGRRYQKRYLTEKGKASYEAELWLFGFTDITYEEVKETSDG